MITEKRGLKNVKTMAGRADRMRVRTSGEALMELSVLANEKQRLELELLRSQRRNTEITRRFAEMAEKEARLYAFIKEPPPLVQVRSASDNGPRLQTTEFCY